jgi:hypothetical protein
MVKLPARQVHLDFHTSECLPTVGRDFDATQFQAALCAGHVNSITVFAKCHHSWSYYPTQVGQVHPTLSRDLLGEQIAACHAIGVRAPIYYTVGWSSTDAEEHPEWTARTADGVIQTCGFDLTAKPEDPKSCFNWKFMCPSGGYAELIWAQTEELCANYPVDGFFYDICHNSPCYCEVCKAGMAAEGMDPAVPADATRYNVLKWQRLMTGCNEIILARHPEATIFYNGGGGNQYHPEWHAWQTHHELEDLPTAWGGYDKFPIRARFFANGSKDYLAMSGKFHTAWGEFGGFKAPEAIRFEAACMIAYGARCSFGDQLPPLGQMDMATYENIGHGYAYVEAIEEYGLDGQPAANLGIWLSGKEPHDQGVASMLMECGLDFAVVAPGECLGKFTTVILPGGPCLTEADAARLEAYRAAGGTILALGESALDAEKTRFLLDVGATYDGPGSYDVDYLVAGEALADGLVAAPFLCYAPALRATLTTGEALASIKEPYFSRTYAHFCSHQYTPYQPEVAAHPGAWQSAGLVYLPHALGEIYHANGARLHRQLFRNALGLIYRDPMVESTLPSVGRLALTHQPDERRYVAHLMYGPPIQRGRCLVIEDLPTLYNVPVTLRVPESITGAFLAPSREPLELVQDGTAVRIIIPAFSAHQAVAFTY